MVKYLFKSFIKITFYYTHFNKDYAYVFYSKYFTLSIVPIILLLILLKLLFIIRRISWEVIARVMVKYLINLLILFLNFVIVGENFVKENWTPDILITPVYAGCEAV